MIRLLLILIPLLLGASTVGAMPVMKVLKGRLLVELPGTAPLPAVGTTLIILDPKGQTVGQAVVSKVQGRRFIARITRGQARPGFTVDDPKRSSGPSKWLWGAGVSTGSNSISAKLPTGTKVALTGSGGGIDFVGDFDALESLRLRFFLSYLPLTGSGPLPTGSCNGSAECLVKINYASLRSQGHWMAKFGKMAAFAGLGLGAHIPVSKDSNLIAVDQVSLTQTVELAAGLDFRWSQKARFSLTLQSLQFPSSSSVTVQQNGLAVHLLKAF